MKHLCKLPTLELENEKIEMGDLSIEESTTAIMKTRTFISTPELETVEI